jgi:hypothetical protein
MSVTALTGESTDPNEPDFPKIRMCPRVMPWGAVVEWYAVIAKPAGHRGDLRAAVCSQDRALHYPCGEQRQKEGSHIIQAWL